MPRVLVLLAAVAFGTTGTAQALGPDASPALVGAARILVGGVLLVVVARLTIPRDGDRAPLGRTIGASRSAVAFGAVGVAAYQLTFFAAVDGTGVAVGTVVALGSGPVFAGLLGRAVHGERLSARWVAATGLAVAGVAVLVAAGATARVEAGGVLLALGAGASYAVFTVAAKALMAAGDVPETAMARLFGWGAVLLLPVLVLAGPGDLASWEGVAVAIYLGAVPTTLAYVLFARGLRHLPSGEVATLTLAEPLTATFLGAAVLGERPAGAALLGVALVLVGLVVLAAPRRAGYVPSAAPPPPSARPTDGGPVA